MREMFTPIGMDNFDFEITAEKRPVLLACIRRDNEYRELIEVLESISRRYGDELKICLLDDVFIEVYRKLGIVGTPTFIIFYEGREKGKMLGKVDREKLNSFVFKNFAELSKA
jgi:hypothetical protein